MTSPASIGTLSATATSGFCPWYRRQAVKGWIPHQSVSDDLVHWKPPWPIVTPDPNAAIEKGETQFYGMSGVLARGTCWSAW